jgi:hypothetical protein
MVRIGQKASLIGTCCIEWAAQPLPGQKKTPPGEAAKSPRFDACHPACINSSWNDSFHKQC